jgi:hypothetical protein
MLDPVLPSTAQQSKNHPMAVAQQVGHSGNHRIRGGVGRCRRHFWVAWTVRQIGRLVIRSVTFTIETASVSLLYQLGC